MNEKKYLNEKELSKMIGIATSTLANQRNLHKGIPYIKFGRAVRYDEKDVISFMESRKIATDRCD